MNDFDTFWHEAKAALRVALQWFFLAVPMGLLCGFLGTLFHLAVEHATELRAAQPWLCLLYTSPDAAVRWGWAQSAR